MAVLRIPLAVYAVCTLACLLALLLEMFLVFRAQIRRIVAAVVEGTRVSLANACRMFSRIWTRLSELMNLIHC